MIFIFFGWAPKRGLVPCRLARSPARSSDHGRRNVVLRARSRCASVSSWTPNHSLTMSVARRVKRSTSPKNVLGPVPCFAIAKAQEHPDRARADIGEKVFEAQPPFAELKLAAICRSHQRPPSFLRSCQRHLPPLQRNWIRRHRADLISGSPIFALSFEFVPLFRARFSRVGAHVTRQIAEIRGQFVIA